MFHLRLIGTSSSRSSSRTACSEIARPTPRSAPSCSIRGTTPEVETVIRRRDRLRPCSSMARRSAATVCVVIEQGLAHAHDHDVGEQPAVAAGRPFVERVARDQHLRHDLGAPRLRTSGMVPVWQKVQVSVQPTWVDTHKAPRSSSGMKTVSTSCPSAKRSSHLRVPSAERCSARSPAARPRRPSAEPVAQVARQGGHRRRTRPHRDGRASGTAGARAGAAAARARRARRGRPRARRRRARSGSGGRRRPAAFSDGGSLGTGSAHGLDGGGEAASASRCRASRYLAVEVPRTVMVLPRFIASISRSSSSAS